MTTLLLAFALLQPNVEALVAQGADAAQSGRLAEAEALWHKALALNPAHPGANFNLGYFHLRQNNPAAAEPFLAKAARANPRDYNSQFLLGNALLQLNKPEPALRALRAALALRPNEYRLLKVISVEYAKGRYFVEAAQAARRAADIQPADEDAWVMAIKHYADAGSFDLAAREASAALLRFPNSARVNFENAFLLHRRGRWADAIPLLEKAIQADPNYEEPFYLYGDALVQQDKTKEAITYFTRAIAIRDSYLPARMALARAYLKLDNLAEARREAEQAARIRPDDPQPPLLLSQILFRQGDEDGARAAREKSMALRRANPAAQEAPQNRPFPK